MQHDHIMKKLNFVLQKIRSKCDRCKKTNALYAVRINNGKYCKFGNFREGFIFAKLRVIKPSRNGEKDFSFTDVSKSCQSPEFLTWQICLLKLFALINFCENCRIYRRYKKLNTVPLKLKISIPVPTPISHMFTKRVLYGVGSVMYSKNALNINLEINSCSCHINKVFSIKILVGQKIFFSYSMVLT